ncbi:hypothetical protein RSOL_214230, partial [Rhizoctonia solani AG-3 Rhs1AP]
MILDSWSASTKTPTPIATSNATGGYTSGDHYRGTHFMLLKKMKRRERMKSINIYLINLQPVPTTPLQYYPPKQNQTSFSILVRLGSTWWVHLIGVSSPRMVNLTQFGYVPGDFACLSKGY